MSSIFVNRFGLPTEPVAPGHTVEARALLTADKGAKRPGTAQACAAPVAAPKSASPKADALGPAPAAPRFVSSAGKVAHVAFQAMGFGLLTSGASLGVYVGLPAFAPGLVAAGKLGCLVLVAASWSTLVGAGLLAGGLVVFTVAAGVHLILAYRAHRAQARAPNLAKTDEPAGPPSRPASPPPASPAAASAPAVAFNEQDAVLVLSEIKLLREECQQLEADHEDLAVQKLGLEQELHTLRTETAIQLQVIVQRLHAWTHEQTDAASSSDESRSLASPPLDAPASASFEAIGKSLDILRSRERAAQQGSFASANLAARNEAWREDMENKNAQDEEEIDRLNRALEDASEEIEALAKHTQDLEQRLARARSQMHEDASGRAKLNARLQALELQHAASCQSLNEALAEKNALVDEVNENSGRLQDAAAALAAAKQAHHSETEDLQKQLQQAESSRLAADELHQSALASLERKQRRKVVSLQNKINQGEVDINILEEEIRSLMRLQEQYRAKERQYTILENNGLTTTGMFTSSRHELFSD